MSDFRQAMAETLCAALQPRHIIMAGRDPALATCLVEAGRAAGVTLHIVGRNPGAQVRDLQLRAGDRCVVHDALPTDAISLLPAPELSWIDTDSNWYTVHSILGALAGKATRLGKPFPVTIVQNTGWPYGRRDSYEDPAAIPEPFRHQHERAGLLPGQTMPAGGAGLFADRYNGTAENEPGHGMLTAVEDFLASRTDIMRLVQLPGFGGLAAICPRTGRGGEVFADVALVTHLRSIAEALEDARLRQAVELKERDAAVQRGASLAAALRAALNRLQTQRDEVDNQAGQHLAIARAPRPGLEIRLRWRLRPLKARLRRALGRPSVQSSVGSTADDDVAADVARLHASPAFDANWYLATYRDVAEAGMDPALHYIRSGAAEFRDPGPFFCTAHYAMTYPDVILAGLNPLLHYLADGGAEGREAGPAFDTRQYLAEHPEIAGTDINPLEHFLGQKEAVLF